MFVLPMWHALDGQGFPETDPVHIWKSRGGQVIDVPECAMKFGPLGAHPYWPVEVDLVGATIVAISCERHLDGKRTFQ